MVCSISGTRFFSSKGATVQSSGTNDATVQQQPLPLDHLEENPYEEVQIDERAELFSPPLIKIFTTKRTFETNELSRDEERVIEDHYLDLKRNKKIHFAYEHLRASADAPTIESVMKFLLRVEKRINHFIDYKPVYLHMMENIPQGIYLQTLSTYY